MSGVDNAKQKVVFERIHTIMVSVKKNELVDYIDVARNMGYSIKLINDKLIYAICDGCGEPLFEEDEIGGHDCYLCANCLEMAKAHHD